MKTFQLIALITMMLPAFLCAVEPPRLLEAKPLPELEKLFENKSGWIGADGDYSVAVSPTRTLWFFSDTWIGEIADGKRTKATMINNSVGVQTIDKGRSKLEYHWGKTKEGKHAAWLLPADATGWLWPFAGTMVGEKLHLFLWQMAKAEGPAAFGFRNVAVWHAVVDNPLDEPSKWKIAQKKLPFTELTDERHRLFGSVVLTVGDITYIYGIEDQPKKYLHKRGMLLAKVKNEHIDDFDRWMFRMDDGWTTRFEDAKPIGMGVASEYSVTAMPDLGGYVSVTNDSFLSPKIVARVSQNPWGPWSDPVTVYTAPEPAWDKAIFAYAGKAHASLSSKNELVVSYASNAKSFSQVLKDNRLYWPKFVGVKLELKPVK